MTTAEWQFQVVTQYGSDSYGWRQVEELGRHGWRIAGVVRRPWCDGKDATDFYMQREVHHTFEPAQHKGPLPGSEHGT